MPYSSEQGKSVIDWAAVLISQHPIHHAVLDVGVGAGTYSDRYSSTILPRQAAPSLAWHWTGVEIWAPYVERFELARKYDTLILSDVKSALHGPLQLAKFDVCFLCDVLEHMSPADAMYVFRLARGIADTVIVSLPIGAWPQGECEGNPYEAHISEWSLDACLEVFSPVAIGAIDRRIGVFVCSKFLGLFDGERTFIGPQQFSK